LFVFLCFAFCFFFPFWWDNNRTTSETPSPGLEAERLTRKIIKTETLLHLNVGIFFILSLSL
jgi:hypothetical protein